MCAASTGPPSVISTVDTAVFSIWAMRWRSPNGRPRRLVRYALVVPPYAKPLSASSDPASWWAEHAPVVVQSAALGPCTNTRPDTEVNEAPPGPDFQGFRLIEVADDRIARVHYVSMEDVRRAAYPPPVGAVQPEATVVTPPPLAGRPYREVVTPEGRTIRDHRHH